MLINESLGVPEEISDYINRKISPEIDNLLIDLNNKVLYFDLDLSVVKCEIRMFFFLRCLRIRNFKYLDLMR